LGIGHYRHCRQERTEQQRHGQQDVGIANDFIGCQNRTSRAGNNLIKVIHALSPCRKKLNPNLMVLI
jgi:hypothetical protein